jgi:predicted Zn-dependent protease
MRVGRAGIGRIIDWLAGASLLAVALTLAGCTEFDAEGRKAPTGISVPSIPAEAPRTTGVETPAAAEHKRLVDMFGGEYHWPSAERHLNAILAKLAQASDKPGEAYKVTLLNTPIVNAFALPSGNLYVTRGLLALANDSSEIAAVMAHEIGHVTAGHASQREEHEKRQQLLSKVSNVLQSHERSEQIQATGSLSLASFSRQQEFEADQIGVRTIARAGYDPYGASRFLTALGRFTNLRAILFGQNQADRPDIMSSHPSTPERIARAIAVARQIGAPGIGEAGRDEYLAAIDGIEFGDNPSEGVVRGRIFSHPRLGFAITAPDGFVLENTSQAVLGVARGGAEAMRLDSVSVSGDTPLEAYLNSGWIEGLQQASIKTITVNGLPAATATAHSGEWRFRLAAVRLGTDLYRIIFATRTLDEETDQRFTAAIESFRRLPSDEVPRLKPLHLTVVAATDSDTVATMTGRMAVTDRPLEYFLLLNGMDRTGPLKAGQRYKIISE